jgi:aryl-alcohol dehydrogenase-like predicted oxidoreductase
VNYRRLGSTGLEVSPVCFGTSRFAREVGGEVQTAREQAHTLLDAFADAGGNFLDTAEIYGDPRGTSERWIGEWLADRDCDREDYVIASKVAGPLDGPPNRSGLGRAHVREAIRGTLERLGTDYVDLYYVHWWDEDTPIWETLDALHALVREGKVHYLGASNLAAWQLTKALWTSDRRGLERFDVVQPRFNAASRAAAAPLLDACADRDVAVCPYSGLEEGFLTGKYEREADGTVVGPDGSRGALQEWGDRFEDRQWNVLDAVREVAGEADATPAQVALRWLMDRPRYTCVPIVAARTVEQLTENVRASEVGLTASQRERITDAYDPEP